jgi:serine/threonine-protein kinase
VRAVVADDVMLVRVGITQLLARAGVDVVSEADNPQGLLRAVALHRPDVAVVDIRMPPTHTDEGLLAAHRIRAEHPATAVVVLSQYLEPAYARRLLAEQPAGLGYVLKQRVADVDVLLDAMRRVAQGECVLDPAIADRVVQSVEGRASVAALTDREREVLGLMAQGLSNAAIATGLHLSERTVESVSAVLFRKLGIEPDPDVNRRVLAVVRLLQEQAPPR